MCKDVTHKGINIPRRKNIAMNVERFCAFVRELGSSRDYILACLFDLSPLDIDVYNYLDSRKNREGEVAEIARRIGRDRSAVQRSLQKLVSLDLCQRVKVSGRGRGYKYVYKLYPNSEIKRRMIDMVEYWRNELLKAIEEVM